MFFVAQIKCCGVRNLDIKKAPKDEGQKFQHKKILPDMQKSWPLRMHLGPYKKHWN